MSSCLLEAPAAAAPGDAYLQSLDASAGHKLQLFAPWLDALELDSGEQIVDMGCGPGALAARLAGRYGHCRVLALDVDDAMLRAARTRHGGLRNLVFERADARQRQPRSPRAWILSSVLHELAAVGGLAAVEQAIGHAAAALRGGGRLIVRDFVRPAQADRPVIVEHARHDIGSGRSLADLAAGARFALRYDGCVDDAERHPGSVHYRTDAAGAFEYLFRKDCGAAWQAELAQQYGFWSREQALACLERTGLRVRHARQEVNRWVVENRVRGLVCVRDADTGAPIEAPLTQIVLVADA